MEKVDFRKVKIEKREFRTNMGFIGPYKGIFISTSWFRRSMMNVLSIPIADDLHQTFR